MKSARRRNGGIFLFEVAIATCVIAVLATLVTTNCVRIHQLLKDNRQHRIARNELLNQLARIREWPADELDKGLDELTPSESCLRSLRAPKIDVETSKSELGTQITLSLTWKRRYPSGPVRLAGWHVAREESGLQADEQQEGVQ